MAAFIKRMFNIKHREIHQDWASREEREQFRRQREEWKNTLYIAGLLR